MLSYGFEDLTSPLPKSCLEVLLKVGPAQLQHRLTISEAEVVRNYDKYLLVAVKTLIVLQERYPEAYGQYMLVTLELY